MGSRRRGNTFSRFFEDIVDDTKSLVDDLIDRAKDLETDARDAVSDFTDDDDDKGASDRGASDKGPSDMGASAGEDEAARLRRQIDDLRAKIEQLTALQQQQHQPPADPS